MSDKKESKDAEKKDVKSPILEKIKNINISSKKQDFPPPVEKVTLPANSNSSLKNQSSPSEIITPPITPSEDENKVVNVVKPSK